jgi:pimeloyl-ACP methyl ester carboxylesterase
MEEKASGVMKKTDVEFLSRGVVCRGMLWMPDDADGLLPAIVMAGGWCYVKEVVMPKYAKFLVEAGYAVLLFDYRSFGDSDGEPRQHIAPLEQQEDYRSAISYLETLAEVDSERIGIWGISYSGGHVMIVGATDPRVKCIVAIVPVVDGYESMRRDHGELRFSELNELITNDRRKRASNPDARGYMPMSTLHPSEELAAWPYPEVYEIFDEIKTSEAPNHVHENTIESVELLLQYTVFPFTKRLVDTPTMLIVAQNDNITSWDLEIEAYRSITTERKELVVLPKTSHMSLYSKQERLELAGKAGARWFAEYL